MILVEDAQKLLFNNPISFSLENLSINNALGRVLAQDIFSTRDQPPFNRVAMDGIAINMDNLELLQQDNYNYFFNIEGISQAGQKIISLKNSIQCIEVMTGAVLPTNCNCVIRYEDVSIENNQAVVSKKIKLNFHNNICAKNSDRKKNDLILKDGKYINSPHINIIASQGISNLNVLSDPQITIISTGDELVDLDGPIKDYQIRMSNSYSLSAELTAFGFKNIKKAHIKDNIEILSGKLEGIISNSQVVILSGGVSKGKFDFVPEALEKCGVKKIFHRIAQKPGKPFWFGKKTNNKAIFGVPGNPISALVCLRRYIIPYLHKSLTNNTSYTSTLSLVRLIEQPVINNRLTNFIPVKTFQNSSGIVDALPVTTNGSGDYSALSNTNGFIQFDLHQKNLKDQLVPFYNWAHCGGTFV